MSALNHAELLKRYRGDTRSGLWHTVVDDGYIHAHLTWHLEQAGQADEIHNLLREETPSGHNGWYETCVGAASSQEKRLEKLTIFAADVRLAWRLAEDLFGASPSRAIALQCRYAMMVSTTNSLSDNSKKRSSAAPSQAVVSKQAGTCDQALAYALQHLDSKVRVRLLAVISDYLPHTSPTEGQQEKPQADIQQALNALKAIQNEQTRLGALAQLVPKLPPNLLPEALAIAGAIQTGIFRVKALKALAPRLPPDLLLEALEIARLEGKSYGYCRSLGLSALVEYLPESLRAETLADALASARTIQTGSFRDNVYFAGALTELLLKLPEALRADVMQETLEAARAIEEDWCRSAALSELAPKLPESMQVDVMQEALDAFVSEEEDWAKAHVLPHVIPNLSPELLFKAFVLAMDLELERDRITALIALAYRMSRLQIDKLLPLWRRILHSLSSRSQRDFMHSLLALAEVVYTLGGREAVAEALVAIQEVGRWW